MIAASSHCKLGGNSVESNSDLLSTVNKLPVFYSAWKNTKTQESTNISSTNSMSSSNSSNSSCTSPIAGSTKSLSSSSSSSLLQTTNTNAMQSHHDTVAPPASAQYYMNQQQQQEYQLYMNHHHHQHHQHQHNPHNQIQPAQQTQSQYSDPHFLHKALTSHSVSQTHDMTNTNALPTSSWWDQRQPTGIASNPSHWNPGHHHGFNNLGQPSFNYDSTDSYNQINAQYSHTAQDYPASHQQYSQLFTSNSPASSVMAAYHHHLSKNFPSRFHIFFTTKQSHS